MRAVRSRRPSSFAGLAFSSSVRSSGRSCAHLFSTARALTSFADTRDPFSPSPNKRLCVVKDKALPADASPHELLDGRTANP